jgi:hypothetical protein
VRRKEGRAVFKGYAEILDGLGLEGDRKDHGGGFGRP